MVTGCWARLLQSFASGIQATTASFCHFFFLKLLVFAAERKGCLYACGDRWPKRRGRDSGEESTQKQNDLVGSALGTTGLLYFHFYRDQRGEEQNLLRSEY